MGSKMWDDIYDDKKVRCTVYHNDVVVCSDDVTVTYEDQTTTFKGWDWSDFDYNVFEDTADHSGWEEFRDTLEYKFSNGWDVVNLDDVFQLSREYNSSEKIEIRIPAIPL